MCGALTPGCACCLQEKLAWSEEVLVSKSELEERRNHLAELEQQVAELTMQTEYQLRLKELHLQVRLSSTNCAVVWCEACMILAWGSAAMTATESYCSPERMADTAT
eukprot:GHRQ01019645.1.p2 GENE.GHRQ01019645.1~~GHRQ01019645.1.p2  ORF type:complete len:107 (+),score=41.11 GHRQ01019645.1:535-855(+)